MKIWLIDDEQPCLDELAWLLKQYPDLELAGMDTNPVRALESMSDATPDAVFLDIDMPKLDGLELALRIQEKCPGVMVIFVTAYSQYALEAYQAHPLDFLMKPVKQTRLDDCVLHLRKHYALLHRSEPAKGGLVIRCFGDFELICERTVKWSTRRARELFLYLIGKNGFPVSRRELLDVLFDGQNDKSSLHNLHMTIYRLKSLLDIIDPERRLIWLTEDSALLFAPGICDFTDFMRFARENAVVTERNASGAACALELYRGSYLEKESYGWADESANEAETEYERIALGLGSFYIAAGHQQSAEDVLTALLTRNVLCEEAHTLLLDLALKTGSREAYLTRYEQYARIMKKDLGLKPDSRYRERYEHLKR